MLVWLGSLLQVWLSSVLLTQTSLERMASNAIFMGLCCSHRLQLPDPFFSSLPDRRS